MAKTTLSANTTTEPAAPAATPDPAGDGDLTVRFLDVGQGDAVLVRTDRGRWLIFDEGTG